MEQFKKIGVFLDGCPGSDEALEFAAEIASRTDVESLLCVHVHGRGGIVPEPDPTPEAFEAEMRKRLPAAVLDRTRFDVHPGGGIAEVLRSTRDESLDLVVVGRRLPSDELGVGSAFTVLARKAPCSVLVVPVYARVHLERYLVPVDCSDHSRRALELTLALARRVAGEKAQVVTQQVYSVGYGYQYTGADFHDAGKQLEDVCRNKLRKFMADIDVTGVELTSINTCSDDPARAVTDLAVAMKLDMVVIGSRGLSKTMAALLGSNAERILMASPIPVLIVKQKGETTHLLSALLGDG